MAKCVKFLAINLGNYFLKSGLSQVAFAKKLGVSATYLNQLLSETNQNPSFQKLEHIARVLGTTLPILISDPTSPVEVHPDVAMRTTVEHLKALAKQHGYSWPPSIDFFLMLFRQDQ